MSRTLKRGTWNDNIKWSLGTNRGYTKFNSQWHALCHDSEPSLWISAFQEEVPSTYLAKFSEKRLQHVLFIFPDYTSFVIRQAGHFWHTSGSRQWQTQKVTLTRQDTLRPVRLMLFCLESDVTCIRKSLLPTF